MTKLIIFIATIIVFAAANAQQSIDPFDIIILGDDKNERELQRPIQSIKKVDILYTNYVFNKKEEYSILTRSTGLTHIILQDDENFSGIYLGDTERFIQHHRGRNIFIKPIVSGISTNGTILTDKRAYKIFLVAVEAGERFHGSVSWHTPSMTLFESPASNVQKESVINASDQIIAKIEKDKEPLVIADFLAKTTSNYIFWGSAEILPKLIIDDNQKTYFRFAESAELPAIFAVDKAGKRSLVNTSQNKVLIIADKVSDDWEFLLGDLKAKATIVKSTQPSINNYFRNNRQ